LRQSSAAAQWDYRASAKKNPGRRAFSPGDAPPRRADAARFAAAAN
jgi:hypothetical protein